MTRGHATAGHGRADEAEVTAGEAGVPAGGAVVTAGGAEAVLPGEEEAVLPGEAEAVLPAEAPAKPMSMKGSFGTAVGSAMLGFEQALRDLPPAETLAAEHAPERGRSGDGHDFVIHFPEALDGAVDTDREA
jgi:hypothetical protein